MAGEGRLPGRGLLGLLLLGGLLLFPALGEAPFERAEIYFMDGARAMVERGDYLVPRYQDQPFFDKPPLAYWLMAAAFRLFGFAPGAARLVPALAALGVIAAAVWLGTLLIGRRSALAGGLVLTTTLAFVSFGRIAMSDMLLALWSTLAVALAAAAMQPGASPWLVPAVGMALGLGFLTKGPIGLLLPGIAIALLLRRDRPRPPAWSLAVAAAVFVVLGFGWFALVYRRSGAEPLAYFFLRENLERFAGETYDTGRPFWYYLPAYLAGGLPWSPFLPLAAPRVRQSGARLLLLWAGLALVPLSLSRGKLDYYLLPLYPAVSIAVGAYFAATPWGRLERALCRGVLALGAAGLALLAFGPLPLPEAWLPGPAARLVLSVASAAGAIACAAAAARVGEGRAAAALAGGAAAVFLVLGGLFLPAFHAAQPNRAVAEDVARERRYRPEARLVACADPARIRRDVLFYTRTVMIERCDLWELASSRAPFLMLLGSEQRASLRAVPGYREVSEHRYLPATALTLAGLLARPEPGVVVLAANYATADPVAEAKRKHDFKRAVRAWEESTVRSPSE